MKFKLLPVFIMLIFFTGIHAQNNPGKISGLVRTIQNQPLAGANIILRSVTDTTVIQKGIADRNGYFLFSQLQNGSYTITVTAIDFKDHQTNRLSIDTTHNLIVLPVIVLQPSMGKSLQGVVVTSKKPVTEQKIDRITVNVDAMLSVAGSNALDALSKSPGVSVDANDGISLNGKNNVLVLIDDRPAYMSATDLAAYLRSLPAGMVDKLELMSNPPARYDANGNAIINIVLKKNQVPGFNGGINLGYNQGVYTRSNNALNINYRTGKFNLFSNISYSHDQNFSDQSYSRYFYKSDGTPDKILLQHSYFSYRTNSWNGRVGIDYSVSPHTILGIAFNGNTLPKNDVLHYSTAQFDQSSPDSVTKGSTEGSYSWKNNGININLHQAFNKKGRVLTVNLDQLNYYGHSNQQSPVYFYGADSSFNRAEQRLFSFPSAIHIYTGKADLAEPFKGRTEFTAGIKSSYVNTDNQFNWFNQQGNNLVPDYSRTNHFKYAERINSAYINLKKEWKRWAIQGGVRVEHTNGNAHQLSNPAIPDINFKIHYTNLFPSLFVLYKPDSSGHNTLVLNFSKRIVRPSYQQLNPFLFFADQYTYNAGNPLLKASFTQYIELRYSFKQYFAITLSYGGGNNGISRITQTNGSTFITTPLNFIDGRLLGIIPYLSLSPTKWWRVSMNGVFLFQSTKGTAAGVALDQHTTVHEIDAGNLFSINKDWSAEVNGFFPGRQTYGQNKNGTIYNISAGIQKKILKGQGTMRLNMNDIFHSLNISSQTLGITQVAEYSSRKKDTRWIGFSFSYRFGKMINARKRNDTGGAEDEKSRTNNSNN